VAAKVSAAARHSCCTQPRHVADALTCRHFTVASASEARPWQCSHREGGAHDADSPRPRIAVGGIPRIQLVAAPHKAELLLLDELVLQISVDGSSESMPPTDVLVCLRQTIVAPLSSAEGAHHAGREAAVYAMAKHLGYPLTNNTSEKSPGTLQGTRRGSCTGWRVFGRVSIFHIGGHAGKTCKRRHSAMAASCCGTQCKATCASEWPRPKCLPIAKCKICAIECRASLLSLSPENVSDSELHEPHGQVLPERFPHSVEIRWCAPFSHSRSQDQRMPAVLIDSMQLINAKVQESRQKARTSTTYGISR